MTCSAAADRPHSEASPHPSDGRPAAGRTSPRHLACLVVLPKVRPGE
jgi:hypothetical protein